MGVLLSTDGELWETALRHKHRLFMIMIITGLVLLASAGWIITFTIINRHAAYNDSGVVACQKMADNIKNHNESSKNSWTEADYHKARKPWEDSKHADLKVAGTNMVDLIYKMDQQANDDASDLSSALVDLSTIHTQWVALQTACANNGVDLPALPS